MKSLYCALVRVGEILFPVRDKITETGKNGSRGHFRFSRKKIFPVDKGIVFFYREKFVFDHFKAKFKWLWSKCFFAAFFSPAAEHKWVSTFRTFPDKKNLTEKSDNFGPEKIRFRKKIVAWNRMSEWVKFPGEKT